MMRHFPIAAIAATAFASLPAQAPTQNVVEVAAKAGQFQTLLAACKAADLAGALTGKGPFTVFAPTDAAFKRLGDDVVADLLKPENKQKLAAILSYHVVAAQLPATKVPAEKSLQTLQGVALPIEVVGGKVKVGGANVVTADVMASNGVIHVIDTVMLPPAAPNLVEVATKAGSFATLLQAAKAAGLAETLAKDGPFTVFAPTDAAFAQLGEDAIADLLKPENNQKLAGILKHHVVAGEVKAAQAIKLTEAKTIGGTLLKLQYDGKTLRVGGAKVVTTDVMAGNGVIHVVDAVIVPAN